MISPTYLLQVWGQYLTDLLIFRHHPLLQVSVIRQMSNSMSNHNTWLCTSVIYCFHLTYLHWYSTSIHKVQNNVNQNPTMSAKPPAEDQLDGLVELVDIAGSNLDGLNPLDLKGKWISLRITGVQSNFSRALEIWLAQKQVSHGTSAWLSKRLALASGTCLFALPSFHLTRMKPC